MGGGDLNVALILRLIDQMSGPGGRVVETLKKMRVGAGEFRRAFGAEIRRGFSSANIEAALAKNERDIRDARGRLAGAFGMALTLGAPVMLAGNFERDMINFANLADLSIEKRRELSRELDRLSRKDRTGMSASDLLAGLSTYVGKGMSPEDGVAALEATGRAAKATGAQFDEMAAAGFAVMDNMKVTPDQLRKAFDMMAASGKEGSFELKDMARSFPELTASAKAIGMTGTEGVASLSAALQIAMKSAGSADQAANNTSNFLGKLSSPDTVRNFKKFGVDVKRELETAAKNGTDPLEHMLTVIDRVTGGDQFKMGELFADKQVLDFLRATIPNLEEYRRIKASAAGADGVVDKDYEAVMKGFNESVTQLRQSLTGLFSASGALLPVLTEMVQGATAMVDAVRDWTVANPELTAWLVKGAAALLTMGIGARVLGYAFAVGRGSLIRFLSLFLKFDDAGRNISLIGRLLRGLGKGFSWARVIPKFAWSSVLSVLRWGAWVPKLAWRGLAGALNWSGLIPALRWGARFIPVIGWALLAGTLAWELLIKPMGWDKYLPSIDWDRVFGAFSWSGWLPEIDWSMLISAVRWPDWISELDWYALLDPLEWANLIGDRLDLASWIDNFDWLQVIDPLNIRQWFDFAWSDVLPEWDWSAIIPALPDFSSWFATPDRPGPLSYRAPQAPARQGAAGASSAAIAEYLGSITIEPPAGARSTGGASAVRPAPVRIEETVKHDYKAENSITITVPVQIVQKVNANADKVARDVGRRVEHAARKALSDTSGPQ